MKALTDILYKVALKSTLGDMNKAVGSLSLDSRKVGPGSLFVAQKGTHVDGHAFIGKAIAAGASVIVCEDMPAETSEEVTYVCIQDTMDALGTMAANFYDHPSGKLTLVGVTGTNGKTTTATLLYQLFSHMGYKAGLLSTVENRIGEEVIPATHTTPDAISLQALLARMVGEGCTHAFMEASSHAIHQRRVAALQFDGAVFTNLSHDHLDYHETFSAYINAKKRLFDDLSPEAFALVNVDDKRGMVMLQNTRAKKVRYGLKKMADYKARVITNSLQGLELDIEGTTAWFRLIGNFNAYNLLAVYAVAHLLGESPEDILLQLTSINTAPGRFEQVMPQSGVIAIVDYAHTPDALQNVLETIKDFRTGNEQVITIVGCGGNRDKSKRPEMARIACELSDKVILTSDNPRDEEPEAIIADMRTGVSPVNYKKTLAITDRREAIRAASSLAAKGDIILLAGKGHETYQEIRGQRFDFDDKKELGEAIKLMHQQD